MITAIFAHHKYNTHILRILTALGKTNFINNTHRWLRTLGSCLHIILRNSQYTILSFNFMFVF